MRISQPAGKAVHGSEITESTSFLKQNASYLQEMCRLLAGMILLKFVDSVSKCSHMNLSLLQVFTAAAADERKNIVLLAFETMEKIVREYFPYITETESVTFTDCVRCLITFTNSRFNSDVSLNAIAFLRFCAFKLADGVLTYSDKNNIDESSVRMVDDNSTDGPTFTYKDENVSFWMPLLTGNFL